MTEAASEPKQVDAELGRLTRDLILSASGFRDMLAVDAPTPVLSRQVDEMVALLQKIGLLAESDLLGEGTNFWSLLGDNTMKLYSLLQHRQAL